MEKASENPSSPPVQEFRYIRFPVEKLNDSFIARMSREHLNGPHQVQLIRPHTLQVNAGIFHNPLAYPAFPPVTILRQEDQLLSFCTCRENEQQFCHHETIVLTALLKREELGVFFFSDKRHEKIRQFAHDYGLATVENPDDYFDLFWENNKLSIQPKDSSLLAVNNNTLLSLSEALLPELSSPNQNTGIDGASIIIVLKQHKYNKHLVVELYNAALTKEGKIKNPLTIQPALDLAWTIDDPDHLKFYTAVHKLQQYPDQKRSISDLKALKAIVRNPARYKVYLHDPEVSENISAASLTAVDLQIHPNNLQLVISKEASFYSIGAKLKLPNGELSLRDVNLRFNWFLQHENKLYLIDQLPAIGIIGLLKSRDHFLIHQDKFGELKSRLLDKLEDRLDIHYQYLYQPEAVSHAAMIENSNQDWIIYLSDLKNYIMIIPVIRYGNVEIPIRTKRQIHSIGPKGKSVVLRRDEAAERQFTALILSQHPHFEEQEDNDLHYWYLHRDRFLSEDWFLQAFETWNKKGITILGFNELDNNKLNPNRVKIDIKLRTGINWFNADISARFGKQAASLKQIYKSIRNQNKYVQLDDGTLGILPEEWISKFSAWFNNAEIVDEKSIRIAKINITAVEQLYEDALPDEAINQEIISYRNKLEKIRQIQHIEIPAGLQGTLRPYQQEGLNWLNALDELHFGGCLADDMGLGKTVQIIAFILSQKQKMKQATNLLIVPSTLVFNWQQEVARFAPSLTICTLHGQGRIRNSSQFDQYDIILTTYGTLISDIGYLKDFTFNYIFLDESQNIKNPETQRYKAVRLLQARNRIAITGTPIENNTFDLFGQLSFACPGLLGNKQYFRDVFSIPIDTFKYSKRAYELHQKVKPFILRRTKEEVATDLPDKTEMVLYCEMGEEQRAIYDRYEKEFRDYISATTDDQLKKNPMNVLKGLTRLRQICDSPALLGDDALTGRSAAKIDTLLEQIESQAPEHKILVFSQFVSMLRLIEAELKKRNIGYAILTGSTRNRGQVVDTFQTNADSRVFLISLKAGGTGLNLTEADYVYIVDPWWNPAVENQAIDRAHRIGQQQKVIAVRLICTNTVEEKIIQMQESKQLLANDLIRPGNALVPALSKNELLQLLSFQPA